MNKERDITNASKTSATVFERGDRLHETVSNESVISQY